jgi:hypothetical protein
MDTSAAAPSLPMLPNTDWASAAAAANALTLGNVSNGRVRGVGDCTIAAMLRKLCVDAANNGQQITFTDDQAKSLYFQLSHNRDTGLNLEVVLKYFQQTGYTTGGTTYKIGGYLAIDPNDDAEVQTAISLFGPIYCGINLPQAWESNTASWDANGGHIIGGHCILPEDWMGSDGSLKTASWGELPIMTKAGRKQYMDEAYIILDPLWYASGKAPNGLDVAALQSDIQAITS